MSVLQKNSILVSETMREYRVASVISSGTGQGDIYQVTSGEETYALKLFYAGEGEQMRRQIEILMKRGKACAAYVHPQDIVTVEGRIGYVMEYIPETYLAGSVLYNGIEAEDGTREELPFHIKLSVLHHLAEAVAVLYDANLAMMDLKFDNLKINPEDWSVKILDTDTVVASDDDKFIIDGTVGFMPPLTMNKKEIPTKHNDAFALAVMIFMTLLGSHPLMGRMADIPQSCDIETYLFAVNPIYVWHPTNMENRPCEDNEMTENKLNKYPRAFLRAMERTFVDGLFEGEKRTSPAEWCRVLQEVYESSYCCRECGEEQFFDGGTAYCDYCGELLVKPLVLQAEKHVPLFFGSSVRASDIWADGAKQTFLKIVATRYSGKYGMLVEGEPVKLSFSSGKTVEFQKGKIVPIFMNAKYKYQNRDFMIREG